MKLPCVMDCDCADAWLLRRSVWGRSGSSTVNSAVLRRDSARLSPDVLLKRSCWEVDVTGCV